MSCTEAALDAFPVALVVVDAAGRIAHHNLHWGRDMDLVAGQLLEGGVHEEDKPAWCSFLDLMATHSGQSHGVALRLIDRHSALRWYQLAGQAREGLYYLSLTETTATRQRELELAARHRSATDLINGLPAMIYRGRINREWSMEFVSQGCVALTGFEAAEVCASLSGYGMMILPEYEEYIWQTVQQALLARMPYALVYRIRCADGSLKQVLEKGTGIFAHNGEVLGIEGLVVELSQA